MGCRLRLAMKHPDRRMTAICVPIEDFRFIDRPFDRVPEFHVQYMAHDIHVERVMMTGFRPIDAYPQLRAMDFTAQSIEDFNIFATPLARTEEIIVEPKSVMELLEQIKAMQSPEQREIRERSRKRDARAPYEAQRATTFHAQILSFKEAA